MVIQIDQTSLMGFIHYYDHSLHLANSWMNVVCNLVNSMVYGRIEPAAMVHKPTFTQSNCTFKYILIYPYISL